MARALALVKEADVEQPASRPPLLIRSAADKELIEAVQLAFRNRVHPTAPPNAPMMEV